MTVCALAFNGDRLDPVSQQYHSGNGYRMYVPALRRFASPDSWSPFGQGGINHYAYCAGDPVNSADPSGHMSWQAGVGIGLGVLGIVGAVFTGGGSLIAAGSISAALAVTSSLSVTIGVSALVADITSVASTAVEKGHPEVSAALGWVSLATGVLSLGIGLITGGMNIVRRLTTGLRRRMQNVLTTGLSGRGAPGIALEWANGNAVQLNQAVAGVELAESLFPQNFSHPLAIKPVLSGWAKSGRGKAMSRFLDYYRERNPALFRSMMAEGVKLAGDPLYNTQEIIRRGHKVAGWLQDAGHLHLPTSSGRHGVNLFAKSEYDMAKREVNKLMFFRAEEFLAVPLDPTAAEFLSHLYERTGVIDPMRFIKPLPDSTGFGPW